MAEDRRLTLADRPGAQAAVATRPRRTEVIFISRNGSVGKEDVDGEDGCAVACLLWCDLEDFDGPRGQYLYLKNALLLPLCSTY